MAPEKTTSDASRGPAWGGLAQCSASTPFVTTCTATVGLLRRISSASSSVTTTTASALGSTSRS